MNPIFEQDVFFEQLVKVRFTPARIAATLVTYGIATTLTVVLWLTAVYMNFAPLAFLATVAIYWMAWNSAGQYKVEYEYAVTNGEFDIDRIINKRKRKRAVTFQVKEVQRLKKYQKGEPVPEGVAKRVYACTPDENTYSLLVRTKTDGLTYIIFSPDEHIRSAMKRYLPRDLATQFD